MVATTSTTGSSLLSFVGIDRYGNVRKKYGHWAGDAACLLRGGGAGENYPELLPPKAMNDDMRKKLGKIRKL